MSQLDLSNAASRVVRIFISSTFRDFAKERDLLVRKVFPELRNRCRKRQVEIVDVDLRWGITEEEAKQGRVLPICLAEIDRSRPFFMCFLGERYGWIPNQDQFDRSLLLEQPWLDEHTGGASVTELEILYGILNNPEMAGRAFFYFRDPAWSSNRGADYASEGSVESQKLASLKEKIRCSSFPVVENYPSPEAIAERVTDDLWEMIEKMFPEAEAPDALTLERLQHEAYSASRRRLYLGGENYFEELNRWLTSDTAQPVLVRGPSGSGKSALLANWLSTWPPDHTPTDVIVHHLGSGIDACDPVLMAGRIMREIAKLVDKEFEPSSDPDEQLDQLPMWLATASVYAAQNNRQLIIVLDGLDKVSQRPHLRWLPDTLPPRVRLVASCLDGEVLIAAHERLEWVELEIQPLSAPEQSTFIRDFLGKFRKQLTAKQSESLQKHPLSGNPLFLLTVLEELRVFGIHEQLDQRVQELLALPPDKKPGEQHTVDDAFVHVLTRIEKDYGRESVQRSMEAIWASRFGLFTHELLELAAIPPATWAGIANSLDESFFESMGRINFGHDYLRQAVEKRYAPTESSRLAIHRRLAEYFAKQEPSFRVAEELPWQWQQALDQNSLKNCLTDMLLFEELCIRDEYELLAYWIWLDEDINSAYKSAWNNASLDVSSSRNLAQCLANFLRVSGCLTDFADFLFRTIMNLEEKDLGSENPKTIDCKRSLATFLHQRATHTPKGAWADEEQRILQNTCYSEAETLYRHILKIDEQNFGNQHPQTLMTIASLAALSQEQGALTEARELYERALIPPQDGIVLSQIDSATVEMNLANLLMDEADPTDLEPHNPEIQRAEQLLRSSLGVFESTLGPDDTTTLTCLSNLAVLLRKRDDYGEYSDGEEGTIEAEAICRRVLERRQILLGPSHPQTMSSVNNLMNLLCQTGRIEEAIALPTGAPPEDHDVAAVEIYRFDADGNDLGRLTESDDLILTAEYAEEFLTNEDRTDLSEFTVIEDKAAAILQQYLPDDHDHLRPLERLRTGSILGILGVWQENHGNSDIAMQSYEKSVGLQPDITRGFWSDLANLKSHQGDDALASALNLYNEAIDSPDFNTFCALLNQAIEECPSFPWTYNYLAWRIATSPDENERDGAMAVEMASKAFELCYYYSMADTLAAAHAENGDFEQAIKVQKQVIELSPLQYIDDAKAALSQYQAQKPMRDEPAY